MERLDEGKFIQLLEWLSEADAPATPPTAKDDDDDEDFVPQKQKFMNKPQAGHKRINPSDMSGPTPEDNPLGNNQMAPSLAGERAKSLIVMGRVKGFIEKYSKHAVDTFSGFQKGTVVNPTSGARADAESPGREKYSQMMSKDKALALVDKLPLMQSSQMMASVRMIGNYIWKVHATMRDELRSKTKEKLKGSGQVGNRTKFDPKSGNLVPTKSMDTDEPAFKDALAAASKEFEIDSVNIKADLNMLAQVAGILKRSGGFGGQADKTFLDRIMMGYVDDSGQYHLLSSKITPKPVGRELPPELKQFVPEPPEEKSKNKKSGGSSGEDDAPAVKARGPIIRKKSVEPAPRGKADDVSDADADEFLKGIADSISRPFSQYMNQIIEVAVADASPKWWDEL